jgi:hypothetical protein
MNVRICKSTLLLLLFSLSVQAQTILGTVLQAQTQQPISQADVWLNSATGQHVRTDSAGRYVLHIPASGRYMVLIQAEGYHQRLIENVLLSTGKETILESFLTKFAQQLDEVTVRAGQTQTSIERGHALVSSKTFDLEQTMRFAGSRNDPARMAMNFAGVVGSNDTRNDIVVRGNAPNGLLFRVEGIDVPNPNHFGAMGATGGPVPILNSQMLKTSSFLTGAFPAAYGNALSGVFDLQLRNGNDQKREHTFQVGFTGFEFGTEGPLSKKTGATYLIHYRYSVLGLLSKLGLNTGTGNATPNYQDLTFKLNLPLAKGRSLSVFGVGGKNGIVFDNTGSIYSTAGNYNDYRTAMGVVGISYSTRLTTRTSLKLTTALTATGVYNRYDTLGLDKKLYPSYRDNSYYTKATLHAQLTHRYAGGHNLMAGAILSNYQFSFHDSSQTGKGMRSLRNTNAPAQTVQVYAQWHYTPAPRLLLNLGVHATYLSLNEQGVVEPRLGVKYELTNRSTLSVGLGNYSRWQDWMLYFNQYEGEGQSNRFPNQSLDFSKSRQVVIGWKTAFATNWSINAEAYYQYLYAIPVDRQASYYSALNSGSTFFTTNRTDLVNAGTGLNYGAELTVEKGFSQHNYLISTLSMFDSRYKTLQNEWHPTAFASHWLWNTLGGYEWTLGTRNTLAIDLKNTLAGGRPYTPIDLAQSRQQGHTVTDEQRPFAVQLPTYWRADVKLTYRRNRPHSTFEWSVDVQNLINHHNAYQLQYSPGLGGLAYSLQMGRYFVVNHRINF